MANFLTQVKEWWRSPLTRTLITGGLGTGLSGITGLFGKLPVWVESVSHTAAGPWVIDGSYTALLFALSAAGHYMMKSKRVAESSLLDYLDPAGELWDRHHESRGMYRLLNYEFDMSFNADYTMVSKLTMTIVAVQRPVFVITQQRGSPNAEAHTLADVAFRVSSPEGPGSVCVLPAEDNPTRKRFLLLPLPPLEPGQEARTFVVTSRWPNAGKKLKEANRWDKNEVTIPRQAASVDVAFLKITVPDTGTRYRVQTSKGVMDLPTANGDFSHQFEMTPIDPGAVFAVKIKRLQG